MVNCHISRWINRLPYARGVELPPKRRRPEGPGFGERGGTNVGDYIGRSERMQEAERRAETAERIAEIPIDQIDRSPYQARSSFDRDAVSEPWRRTSGRTASISPSHFA